MQKQTYKATLSISIATLLALSLLLSVLLPIIPVSAITSVTLTPNVGHVDDIIAIDGTGAGPGSLVTIYWDKIAPDAVLNDTYADINGEFECNVTIPVAPLGVYPIYAEDGASVGANFNLQPKVTVDPDTGLPDDTITVEGTGFEEEEEVEIGFWNQPWQASGLQNYSWIMSTDPATVETTADNGTFTCTIDVPDVIYTDQLVTGDYYINATEVLNTAVWNETVFTVGATITLDPEEGPSGTIVEVDGTGFTKTAGLDIAIVVSNDTYSVTAFEVDDIETKSDGSFAGEFIVPTLAVDTYDVNATDGTVISGAVDFEVRGRTSAELTPASAPREADVTIEGVNFTAISGTEANITIYDTYDDEVVEVDHTLTTNSTGGIAPDTFTIPMDPALEERSEPYYFWIMDENGLWANVSFRIVSTWAFLNPEEGASGRQLTVWVEGLTADSTYNVTIDGQLMVGMQAKGDLDSNGEFADPPATNNRVTLYVPTLDEGTYTVTVTDDEGVIATEPFVVTETTGFVLDPASAPADYNVTIEASYFMGSAGRDITITVYNDTWEEDLSDITTIRTAKGWGNLVETNGSGWFLGSFDVPEDMSLGDYWINVTDDSDLDHVDDENVIGVWALPFSVVEETVDVSTARDTYTQGEDVTFKIRGTFDSPAEIEVMDPEGFNRTVTAKKGDYEKIDTWYYAYPSLRLPTDAHLGTYIWQENLTDSIGEFEVVEAAIGPVMITRLNELVEDLDALSAAVDDLSTATATDIGDVSTTVNNVEAAVDELESDVADLASAISDASAAASAASSAAADAASAAADAKAAADAANTTSQGISMAVYGAMALSLVAAIAAIAAVLTLQRKVAG